MKEIVFAGGKRYEIVFYYQGNLQVLIPIFDKPMMYYEKL